MSGGSESTGARRSQKAAIPRCTSTSVLWRSGKSSQNALHTLEGKQPRSMHACMSPPGVGGSWQAAAERRAEHFTAFHRRSAVG